MTAVRMWMYIFHRIRRSIPELLGRLIRMHATPRAIRYSLIDFTRTPIYMIDQCGDKQQYQLSTQLP